MASGYFSGERELGVEETADTPPTVTWSADQHVSGLSIR